eukprot:gene18453-24932_t
MVKLLAAASASTSCDATERIDTDGSQVKPQVPIVKLLAAAAAATSGEAAECTDTDGSQE